jgi:predicted lipid-binding transport protein (Tim44 family)
MVPREKFVIGNKMSAQIVELLVFAGIAFLIISKLIATLGTTVDDDPAKNSSYFGEPGELKDVTSTKIRPQNIINAQFSANKMPSEEELRGLIVETNFQHVFENYNEALNKLPSLNLTKFIRSAKIAFNMILDTNITDENLAKLVDKRYIEEFKSIAKNYGGLISHSKLDAKISDLYMFGNNVFIKILFTGYNITSKIKDLNEEWTFTRSLIKQGNEWHLTNIDRL